MKREKTADWDVRRMTEKHDVPQVTDILPWNNYNLQDTPSMFCS